ncbi:hypothetical protein MRB53_028130 [Persea americana]|uniref:Uncharacterized protein n=1 Tax=Persea americana TaxID=3435 RepID=A0ACC2KER2_PERAE|nr:hypothetical protein MRB53_028130 [Persea americana]
MVSEPDLGMAESMCATQLEEQLYAPQNSQAKLRETSEHHGKLLIKILQCLKNLQTAQSLMGKASQRDHVAVRIESKEEDVNTLSSSSWKGDCVISLLRSTILFSFFFLLSTIARGCRKFVSRWAWSLGRGLAKSWVNEQSASAKGIKEPRSRLEEQGWSRRARAIDCKGVGSQRH